MSAPTSGAGAGRSGPLRICWRLLSFGKGSRGTLALAFLAMAILALTTGLFAYLMGPALRFLLSGGTLKLGPLRGLFPGLAHLDRGRLLWIFPLGILGIGAVKGLAYLGQFYWMGLFGQKLVVRLRRAIFERYVALSPVGRGERRAGDLLERLSSDVAAVETAAVYTVGSYVRDALQIAVLLGVALVMSWKVALGILALVPLAAWPVSRITRKFLRRSREGQERLGALATQLHEGLAGLRTLQAFNAETAERRRFTEEASRQERAMIRAGWIRGGVPGLMEILAAVAVAGALALTARVPLAAPENLISLLAALLFLYQPVKDMGRTTQFAFQAAVAGERLFAVLDAPEPMRDGEGVQVAPRLTEGIEFAEVRFAYDSDWALDGLTFTLREGEVVALVGPSGAGKSTVTSLLLRFAKAQGGQLRLDGVDVDSLSIASVRAQFALVTQEPLLFADSVLENLRLGRPSATREEVEGAARIAQADGFIRELPEGYDTRLGERGVTLSGGQRQRLCLARAVLADAPVLILDEATSSLDPKSEREVQAALASVLVGRTALVIAHRLSTVVAADRICVLESGRITEAGTHAELLARKGTYARMWSLQQGGQASEVAA